MSDDKLTIAIDGPAGSGKSTVAREVARRLGYTYIDTGAMYRALTLAALRRGISPADHDALANLATRADIRLRPDETGRPAVLLDGDDVTAAIREAAIDRAVSTVARHAAVREQFLHLQREIAAGGGVVMDGRDIGTHVLPGANIKVFLTASLTERTRRRLAELVAQGRDVSAAELEAELAKRDQADRERPVAPLVKAPDAIEIDSSGKSIDDVVTAVLTLCANHV